MNQPVQQTTSLAQMKNPAPRELSMPSVTPGFSNLQSFELMQRAAKLLASSTLVPTAYRSWDEKKGDNPNALANCVVALNMSQRMGADPLMVMQNLHIIEGRPSWSSQWVIASINSCGRFAPLRYELTVLGNKEVEYTTIKWSKNQNGKSEKTEIANKATVKNIECVAWTVEKGVNIPMFSPQDLLQYKSIYQCCKQYGVPIIESPMVSMELAVKEGWYGKAGSKWQTMPEVMLRYRTASFFGKLYAPELLMGLQTVEEVYDIVDINSDGSIAGIASNTTIENLRKESLSQLAEERVAEAQTIETVDKSTGEITDQSSQASGNWTPSPEEQAEIKQRELQEAGIAPEPTTTKPRRAAANLE